MFASGSLLALSSLLVTTSLAQSQPYSKFINDANSLIAAATGSDAAQLNALYTWQATQTAIPTNDLSSQYQDYLDAYMTTTSASLPAWVTALPSSLQSVATSFLQAEASLVVQDIAPIVSQNNEAISLYSAAQAAPTTSSSNTTVTPTSAPSATLSSGFVSASANVTASQASGNGTAPVSFATSTKIAPITTATGSPTKSVASPSATVKKSSGAEKPAGVAVVAAVIGILGVVVLL